MKALDTNVLVRFLVRDDEQQAMAVYRKFKEAETNKEDFFIPAHKGTDSHGDRFMSMVLCLQAFMSKRSMARYTLQSEKPDNKHQKVIPRRSHLRANFKY